MTPLPTHSSHSPHIPTDSAFKGEKRGGLSDVAFAVESVVACFATDFVDIGVRAYRQCRREERAFTLKELWGEAAGHAAAGELISDPLGGVAFVGVKRYVPQVMTALGWALDLKPVDWVYDKIGHASLRKWAAKEGLTPQDAAYQDKLSDWKFFQKQSVAQWAIVTVASIAANVAVQKTTYALSDKIKGHDHAAGQDGHGHGHGTSVKEILKDKILGVIGTLVVVVGLRLVFPETMKKVNHWYEKMLAKISGRKSTENAPEEAPTPIRAQSSEHARAEEKAHASTQAPEKIPHAEGKTVSVESSPNTHETQSHGFAARHEKAPPVAHKPLAFQDRVGTQGTSAPRTI